MKRHEDREKLTGKEAAAVIKACEQAKARRDSTVIVIFKRGRFEVADVNQHYSRVA